MIKDNIIKVRERIALSCAKLKRSPAEIRLVAVTKNRSIEEIREAMDTGLLDFGENRVKEAVTKFNQRSTISSGLTAIKLHLIGRLQSNKVKEAVKLFDLIQSIDSLNLAEAVNKQAAKINKLQDILLEVKVSPEPAKFGLKPEEVIAAAEKISGFKNIKIKGLMAIAPIVENPEQARPYFRRLKQVFDQVNGLGVIGEQFSILSMGMTDDFEVAVEEGATMLRLGRAIFEG